MHFQPGLLRLPIPKIEDTCARYLAALEPVAPSADAFTKTQELVQDFQRNGGMGHGNNLSVVVCALGVCICSVAREADSGRQREQTYQLHIQALV